MVGAHKLIPSLPKLCRSKQQDVASKRQVSQTTNDDDHNAKNYKCCLGFAVRKHCEYESAYCMCTKLL
eukprot:1541106-Amphidinium_carterae.1